MRSWPTLVCVAVGLLASLVGSRQVRSEPVPASPVPGEIIISCRPAVPPPVACWAVPSRTPAECGGYIGGGGGILHRDPRYIQEGTWGWDYQGWFGLHKVFLLWNHGRRYQGGEGAYRTQGHKVYNILMVPPPPEKKTGADH